jgi:predicted CxxxxCH...CXXCH cytochrome family protein
MLPKVLFGAAFSPPINGRDDGRAKSKSVPDAVGTEGSCTGGTCHSPGAGSLCVKVPWRQSFLGAKVFLAPSFSHPTIPSVPQSPRHNRPSVASESVASVRSGVIMGTTDHRKCAEECVAMARLADAESDKALWLTLAQSWVRLAEHVARMEERATVAEASEEVVA